MRDVTSFIVVFPRRLDGAPEERRSLLQVLKTQYPHYDFEPSPGQAMPGDDEFSIIPVIGEVGGDGRLEGQICLRRPLDPRVVPDIVETLKLYAAIGVAA